MTTFHILGARGRVEDAADFVAKVQELPSETLPLDADMICGRDHLESAVLHAIRALDQGTNASPSVAMETMLYASGERQISKAKSKIGVKNGMERFAVIVFDRSDPENALAALGLTRDDSVLAPSPGKARNFGISEEELASDNAEDLVLERVAFVEVLKR